MLAGGGGGSVILFKLIGRDGAPKRGGPAAALDTDETVLPVDFQGQTFKVACSCAGTRQDPKEVANAESGPAFSPGGEGDARPSLEGNEGVAG